MPFVAIRSISGTTALKLAAAASLSPAATALSTLRTELRTLRAHRDVMCAALDRLPSALFRRLDVRHVKVPLTGGFEPAKGRYYSERPSASQATRGS